MLSIIPTGRCAAVSVEADKFVFLAASDSTFAAAGRDVITDFGDHATAGAGADLLDLSAVEANTATALDQAFSFNATAGAAFSGTAGSLIWKQFAGAAIVYGDVNGDKVADFAIQLNGTHALLATDFIL